MNIRFAIASSILLSSSTFAASALWDGPGYNGSWAIAGASVGWVDGGSNTTVPNGVGDVAQFDNNSFFGSGGSLYMATDTSGNGSVLNVTLGGMTLVGPTSGRGFDLRSPTAGTSTLTFAASSGNAFITNSATGVDNSGINFDVNIALSDSLDVFVQKVYGGSRTGIIFREQVTGAGAINKTGAGLISFQGTAGANTFSGGLNVSNGSVFVEKDGALGTGDVRVEQSAIDSTAALSIGSSVTDGIDDAALLFLGSDSGNFATISLSAGVNETIGGLYFDNVLQASGTWGATGSGAANINDDWFAGSGMLTVVPEPSTYALGIASLALIVVMVRRRK
ncbi:PEP-CTERM sorting domain-containing protein [Cerasicoccus fimbriatus]|uniref:PEP-CTERM sorting domain-containing protein n=1 Tax=Cerasicoccus fimbriatus TaxID=3014554 RepID=UPI0022B43FBB|nr:PEP-CTERM sorting domain-containing protein [Cerasicoccus sp. TK19100]